MKREKTCSQGCWALLLATALIGFTGVVNANAALTVIGTQYQEDRMFTELDCYWNGGNYPGPCPTNHPGANLRRRFLRLHHRRHADFQQLQPGHRHKDEFQYRQS